MKSRSSKNDSSQLDVPLRQQKQQRELLKQQMQAASSPTTTALRPRRFRAISDGVASDRQLQHSLSPPDPPISASPLPVVGEDSALSALQPPPSPSTPQKKVWEYQFGSFLRNRLRGSRVPPVPHPISLATVSPSKQRKGTSDIDESSVRGGKFFSGVFRSTDSEKDSGQHRRVKSFSHTDELDGTLRRGIEKSYSPGNQRFVKTSATWNNAHSVSQGSLPQTRSAPSEGYGAVASAFMPMDAAPPAPPLFVTPSNSRAQTGSEQEALDASSSSAMKKAFTDFHNSSHDANSAFLGDDPSVKGKDLFWAQKNQHLRGKGDGESTLSSSNSHGSIVDAITTAASLTAHRPPQYSLSGSVGSQRMVSRNARDAIYETVRIVKSQRILKLVSGVESWKTGRRYLIAPAALAACPVAAVSSLFGNSSSKLQSAEQAALAIQKDMANPFETIVLGECLLTYVNDGQQQTSTVKEWSSANLVLRQNYLLEYDFTADYRRDIPRGYAHLQHAKTRMHEHFDDTLELHFYGSPCAKADLRVLMIRIVKSWQSDNDKDKTHHNELDRSRRPAIREHWKTCLNRASSLSKVSDLYEYDEKDTASSLGSSKYVEVRAARRRRPSEQKGSAQNCVSSKYDCALKIFDKNKFWRMVVKGRERADTLVRETAVQATLTAKCGRVPSFLRIRGFFETADNVVLELELLEGTDLFQYISSKGVLAETEAALILRDILRCLHAINRLGLAHRDIKPSNILMCSDFQQETGGCTTRIGPRVKVGDFGMAAFVGVDGQVRGRCGTPGYVAPEIFSSGYGGYGNKVDVFSAGVTLYVMLCGYEPFYGETDEELVEANKLARVDFPAEDWGKVSEEAKDLVRQMLQSDPDKRIDARQALQHPWIAGHFEPEELDRSLSIPSEEAARTNDACIVS